MENDRSESLNSMEAREILALYSELGVTETLDETPINRFEQNKEKITEDFQLSEKDLLNGKYILAQKGKKNYFLIICA